MKAVFISIFTFLIAPLALAHAHLQSSEPVKGAQVKKLPNKVILTFSENLELTMSKIEVRRQSNQEVLSTSKIAYADSKKNVIEVALKSNETADTYEVQWKAVGTDGHPVKGSYLFSVIPEKK